MGEGQGGEVVVDGGRVEEVAGRGGDGCLALGGANGGGGGEVEGLQGGAGLEGEGVGEGGEGEEELVVERVDFYARGFPAREEVVGEGRAPFYEGIGLEGDYDFFAVDGSIGETGVDGEEVGEVGLEGGDDGGEGGCLGGWWETLVFLEGVADDAAVSASLKGE